MGRRLAETCIDSKRRLHPKRPQPRRLHRKQIPREDVELTIENYRRIRDIIRKGCDEETEYRLRDALDAIWWRLKWSERRTLREEFEDWYGAR